MELIEASISDLDKFSLNLVFISKDVCYGFKNQSFSKWKIQYSDNGQIQFNLLKTTELKENIKDILILYDINLGIIHSGYDLHLINLQTFECQRNSIISDVQKIIPNHFGYIPVPIMISDQYIPNKFPQKYELDLSNLPLGSSYSQVLKQIQELQYQRTPDSTEQNLARFIIVDINNCVTAYDIVHEQCNEEIPQISTILSNMIEIYQFHGQNNGIEQSEEELSYIGNDTPLDKSRINPVAVKFTVSKSFQNVNLGIFQLENAILINDELICNIDKNSINELQKVVNSELYNYIIKKLNEDLVYAKFNVKSYINDHLDQQEPLQPSELSKYLKLIKRQRTDNQYKNYKCQQTPKIRITGPNIDMAIYENKIQETFNSHKNNIIINQQLHIQTQTNNQEQEDQQPNNGISSNQIPEVTINRNLINQSVNKTIKYVPGKLFRLSMKKVQNTDEEAQSDHQRKYNSYLHNIQVINQHYKQKNDQISQEYIFIAVPILISLQYQDGIEIIDIEDDIILDQKQSFINCMQNVQQSFTNGVETIQISNQSAESQSIIYYNQFNELTLKSDQFQFTQRQIKSQICFLPLYSYNKFENKKILNTFNILFDLLDTQGNKIINIVQNRSIQQYNDLLKQVIYSYNQLNLDQLYSSIQELKKEQANNSNKIEQSYIYALIGVIYYTIGNYMLAVDAFLEAEYLNPLDVIRLFLHNLSISKLLNPQCQQSRYNFPPSKIVENCEVIAEYFKNIITYFLSDNYWIQITQQNESHPPNYFEVLGKTPFEQEPRFKKRFDNIYFQDIFYSFLQQEDTKQFHSLLINIDYVMHSQHADDVQLIGKIKALAYYLRIYLDDQSTWTQTVREIMKTCKLVGDFEYLNQFLNSNSKYQSKNQAQNIQLILRVFFAIFLSMKPFSIQSHDAFLLFTDGNCHLNKSIGIYSYNCYLNNEILIKNYNDVFGILTLLSYHNLASQISSILAYNFPDNQQSYIEFSLCSYSFGENENAELQQHGIIEELHKLQLTNNTQKQLFWQYFPYVSLHYPEHALELVKQKFMYVDKNQKLQQQYLFLELLKPLQMHESEYKAPKDKYITSFNSSMTYQVAWGFYQHYTLEQQNNTQFIVIMTYYFSKCIQNAIEYWKKNSFNLEAPSWQIKQRFNWLYIKAINYTRQLIAQNFGNTTQYNKIYAQIHQNFYETSQIIKKYYNILNIWVCNADLLIIQQEKLNNNNNTGESFQKLDVLEGDNTDYLSITEQSNTADVIKRQISQSNFYSSQNDKSIEEEYYLIDQTIMIEDEIKHMIDDKMLSRYKLKTIKYIHYQVSQLYLLMQETSNIAGCFSNQFESVVKHFIIQGVDQQKQISKALNVVMYLRQQQLINVDKTKSNNSIINNFISRLDNETKESLQSIYHFNVKEINEIVQQIYQLSDIYLAHASQMLNQTINQSLNEICEQFKRYNQISQQNESNLTSHQAYKWSPVYFIVEFIINLQLLTQLNIIQEVNMKEVIQHFLNINSAEGKLLARYTCKEMILIFQELNMKVSETRKFLLYAAQMSHQVMEDVRLKHMLFLNKQQYNHQTIKILQKRKFLISESTKCPQCKQPLYQNELSQQQQLQIINKASKLYNQNDSILIIHKTCLNSKDD